MGVDALYNQTITDTTKPITGQVELDRHIFQYEIYLLPIIGSGSESVNQELVARLGTRFHKNEPCLGVTESVVQQNIENNEYSAMIFVKNKRHNDVASASIQFYDWCDTGKNQIWINDLCRVAEVKQSVSPVRILFQVAEMVAHKYTKGIYHVNLMVDNTKPDHLLLINIYKKYGFRLVDAPECFMNDPNNKYSIMRKRIDRNSGLIKSGKIRPVLRGGRKSKRNLLHSRKSRKDSTVSTGSPEKL